MPLDGNIGRHLIADLSGIAADRLRDAGGLMRVLRAALTTAGFHILHEQLKQFPEDAGFTGVVLLAESHATVHTYPEHGYAAFDLFACGDSNPQAVLDAVVAHLAPGHTDVRTIARRVHGAAIPAIQ